MDQLELITITIKSTSRQPLLTLGRLSRELLWEVEGQLVQASLPERSCLSWDARLPLHEVHRSILCLCWSGVEALIEVRGDGDGGR